MQQETPKPTHVTIPTALMFSVLCLSSFPVFISTTGLAAAEEPSVNPGINLHYQNARHAEWVPVFESESREVFAQRDAILTALNIEPGMRIADIGAGTGFFSLLFAEKAGPEGMVYAVDIVEDFIKAIEQQAKDTGTTNLVGIINDGRKSGLSPNSIDLAFICDTYHHFEYPKSMIHSIHQALTEHGEVVIIDFRTAPDVSSAWVRQHVRANRDEVIDEMRDFGFELTQDLPLLRTNYFLRFLKR